MTPELHKAFDTLANLCELAKHDQESITALIAKLDQVSATFSNENRSLVNRTLAQMERTLPTLAQIAADTAAASVIERISAANLAAETAERAYERAARFSIAKICGVWMFILVVIAVTVLGVIKFLAPSWADIQARRDEEIRVQRSLDSLMRKYPNLNIDQCDHRPCVRIDKNAKFYGTDSSYRILYGY